MARVLAFSHVNLETMHLFSYKLSHYAATRSMRSRWAWFLNHRTFCTIHKRVRVMVCTIIVVWLLLLLRVLGQNMIALCNIASSASWIVCTVRTELCTHLLWEMPFRKGSIYIYIFNPNIMPSLVGSFAFGKWKPCWLEKELLMGCHVSKPLKLEMAYIFTFCETIAGPLFAINLIKAGTRRKKTHFLSGNGPCVEV